MRFALPSLCAETSIKGILATGYEDIDLAPYFEGPWVLEVDLDSRTCIGRWHEEVYTHASKGVDIFSGKETSNSPTSRCSEVQVKLKFLMGDSGHM